MENIKWVKLYSSLKILVLGETFPIPMDSDLDAFEAKARFKLPESYREYIKVFGSGVLGGAHNILAPFNIAKNPSDDVWQYLHNHDLEAFNDALRDNLGFGPERARRIFIDWERISRMVYFANEIGGDVWGWDPEDIREASSVEYGIYFVDRGERESTLVATNFTSFIEDVCFAGQIGTDFGQDPNELPQREFEPTIVPEWFPKDRVFKKGS